MVVAVFTAAGVADITVVDTVPTVPVEECTAATTVADTLTRTVVLMEVCTVAEMEEWAEPRGTVIQEPEVEAGTAVCLPAEVGADTQRRLTQLPTGTGTPSAALMAQ